MTAWTQQIDNTIVEPADIHGLVNGQFPDSALVLITDHAGTAIGRSSPTVKRAWQAMAAAAAKDGVFLSVRGGLNSVPSGSYRSLAEQQGLWNDNYDHTDHGHGGRSCGGDYRYLKTGKNEAACPGTSNHGRSLAFDTNTEDGGVLGWLEGNAKRFGFQWETHEEWHIHYYPGDNIPQAVLDHEHGHQPSEEDDDMRLIQITDGDDTGKIFLVNGDCRRYIDTQVELDQLIGLLGPVKTLGNAGWQNIVELTALDALGLRSIPPNQYKQLVADVAAAVKTGG